VGDEVELSMEEIREVAGFAVVCAKPVLVVFEGQRPDDGRAREAVVVAEAFAAGGARLKALRDAAWAAQKAAQEAKEAGELAASEAARAAMAAAGAAFLHPLAKSTQVKLILGAAGHAARAFELAGDDPAQYIAQTKDLASPVVKHVLRRYPEAPAGGGRVGQLIRDLDTMLR
jgi:hypothetical protein